MFSDPQHTIEQINLDPGMIVADFGAGTGFYSLEAARIVGDSGKVYAIDVQKELLAKLKSAANASHLRNIEIIWGDVEKPGGTRLKDSYVHFVIASNTLFQMSDKKACIEEAKRILKPGGKILIVDWADSFGGIGPHKEHVFSETSAKTLLESFGFKLERNIKAGEHHYGMLFRKMA